MHDDETNLAFDRALDDLFVEAERALPANPALVGRVLAQVAVRLRRRRLVLVVAAILGMVCCALLLLPALSALVMLFGSASQLASTVTLAVASQSPYLIVAGVAAGCWLLALSAEPG